MSQRKFMFTPGDRVKEKITGFEGVITGCAFYLTGCNQYLITAKIKDDFSEPIALWYDEGRIELISSSEWNEKDVKALDNGCDALPNVGRAGR